MPQPGTTTAPVDDAFTSTVLVCSRVEGRLARYILLWDHHRDVISLSVASPALSDASESPGPGRACPRLLAQASMGRNRARPSPPSHFVRVGPAPDTGPGHGSAHPSRRTRRGERRRGALLAGVPAGLNPSHTARHRDCPARPGPAGRPEHHQRAGRWAQN